MHASVIIKFKCVGTQRKISIFVFEIGTIIITAAQNYNQIMKAYYFINKFLYDHYNEIVYYPIEDLVSQKELLKLIDE